MRKIVFTAAASVAILSAAALVADRAHAVTLPTAQNNLSDASDSANLKQDVRWVCNYGYYGRRHCWWAPGYGYGRYRRW